MMATSEQARHLVAYLTHALNLPANIKWIELRMGVDEDISVKCEFYPDVVDQLKEGWANVLRPVR